MMPSKIKVSKTEICNKYRKQIAKEPLKTKEITDCSWPKTGADLVELNRKN